MRRLCLSVLVSGLLLGACHERSAPAAPPVPTVQVVPVARKDVPILHEWIGHLDGFVNADIRPQVTGYVMAQVYRDGAFVRRGDVLFLIDPRNRKDAAADAWTQVTSRVDGVAGIAQVQVGNLVNTSTPLTTVSQVDPIKAEFNINEVEYLALTRNHWAEPGLREDPPLELVLQDGTVYPHRGTVVAVNRQFSAQTRTINVEGAFPNPGRVLRPGQYARVRAAVEIQRNAFLVPQGAIRDLLGNYQVGVVGDDGKLQIRTVRTTGQLGPMSIVDEGLSEGERVIVSDLTRLGEGMAVHAVPASERSTTSAGPSPGVR